jgi:two-component system sensor histidine kinase AtoS
VRRQAGRMQPPEPGAGVRRQAEAGTGAVVAEVSDQFFRQIVANMRNGVIAVTTAGRLAFANDAAYATLDLQPHAEHAGMSFAEVFRERPDIVRVLASAFELTHLPNRAELRLKSTDKVIGYTLSQVKDGTGTVVGATLFFKDLTRVEQLEERERLRDRLAALGEMAAAIAHELKNPLAGIEVMAGLLRRHVPQAADMQSLLNDIISEAKMANAIVQEVLEFVRPIRLEVQPTTVSQVLHDAVRTAEGKARRRDVLVTTDVDAAVPPIQVDHHQLCQVFTNLLVNAFEALDGRGRVTIAARSLIERDRLAVGDASEPVQTVVIDVADDGPGMPEELVDRIFDPFFTTKAQGSGLGLAIVRKIVDAHDGRIDVRTGPGRGTRFRVTLPVSGGREWFERVRS